MSEMIKSPAPVDYLILYERTIWCLLLATLIVCGTMYLVYVPYSADISPPYWDPRMYITADYPGKRLGNTIFIYAAVLGVARMRNMTPVFGEDMLLRSTFRLRSSFVPRLKDFMPPTTDYMEYGRRACAYDMRVETLPRVHAKLFGYYQSWKYFRRAETELRRSLLFQPDVEAEARGFLRDSVPTGGQFRRIGVHVRRGDFLDERKRRYGYTVASAEYFVEAMTFFRRRNRSVQFIVCSDDISWCRENIRGEDVIYSEGRSAGVDLAILSMCNDTIMSTGSFSWWAAWLANGTAVYYADWPAPSSVLEYQTTKSDYFLPHWIPMSASQRKHKRSHQISDIRHANKSSLGLHNQSAV